MSFGMFSIEYPSGIIDLGNEFYMRCHSLIQIDLFSRYVTDIQMIYRLNEHIRILITIFILIARILMNMIVRIKIFLLK
jgi:hypothetical protein